MNWEIHNYTIMSAYLLNHNQIFRLTFDIKVENLNYQKQQRQQNLMFKSIQITILGARIENFNCPATFPLPRFWHVYNVLYYVSAVLITCIIYIFHAYAYLNYCLLVQIQDSV
jgi:hypothetical protein